MDDTAPSLVLNGPAHMSMKQCDKYVERGVQVLDANSENTDRCDNNNNNKEDMGLLLSSLLWGTVSVCDSTYERGGE